MKRIVIAALIVTLQGGVRAALHTLNDVASPISVTFNDVGGKFTVTHKSSGWVWRNPDTLVSSTNPTSVSGVSVQPDGRTLNANITISGNTYALTAELRTAPSELRVTLGGAPTTNLSSVNYPHPFYANDGQGHAVLPFDSGYVVPNSATTFTLPGGMRGMEWYGGTDANQERAWMAIIDSPDDYELKVRNGTISGVNYLGAVMNWRGSNGNTAQTANKLSYDRTVRYRFLDSGGYVAMAKIFRAEAQSRGWLKTFAQKRAEPGAAPVDQFVGSPIIYLWGDGRSTAALDALKNAGVDKAHIQVSVNHSDHQRNFPATNLADRAWFDAVRARGFTGGVYDIYASVRTSGTGGSPYDGFFYLWPGNAATEWISLRSDGTPGPQPTVSAQMAASFAANTRMPAHTSRFAMDAYFYDVVCAVDLTEDYNTTYGHFATRSMDRVNRTALLNTAYANPTRKLLTATEQGRSWAVPVVHWTEGKFWIGNGSSGISDGAWNDNAYPQIMSDVVEPTSAQLGALMSDGYQAPLWDLVFHDCVVTTVHWHRPHNKYVYLWDHQDRWALLRGQAPLLNLTFDGVQGLATRTPNMIIDAQQNVWTTRLTANVNQVARTYEKVCTWHQQIGQMEMIGHGRLTSDRTVQYSEFSNDGGASGKGIVVNFGTHDGATGITGAGWSGILRGQNLSVPVADYRTYTWGILSNTAPIISALANQTITTGAVVPVQSFTISDDETAADSLTLEAESSNPTLVPEAGITFGGSGGNRTVAVTPANGQAGATNITIRVSDGSLVAQTTFTLTVNPPNNTPPTISSISNQFTTTNTPLGPIPFTIGDTESPAGSLLISAASSNTTLLPVGNINISGSDANRTLTLTPVSGQTGSSTVTITISDGGLSAQASFVFTVSSAPLSVTSLAAQHQHGQTYLTWNETTDPTATYRIYRSGTPFSSAAQFHNGTLIGIAAADSSFDARLSEIRSTTYYYRINAGPDLTATQGLFVHTPIADGLAYYAVMAVASGVEHIVLSGGQNTTSAVTEIVSMPEPVFQRNLTVNSRTVEVYAHWVSASATPHYPAMGNRSSVAHHFGLVRNGTATTHSLLIRPHARQGSFLSTVSGTNDANEWVLTLDDWMPNSIENTFWYGYHETFDIESGLPQSTSGIVHDYTTRRAKWEIEWAMRTLPLDLNRLYMTGHSMGGIGSHFLSLMLPGKIAAIWTTSAKYDFSFLNDPNPMNIWNSGSNERANSGDILWGTVATDLMSSEGLRVYDRLNAGDLVGIARGIDQPVMIAFHGKNDFIVGWAEKIGFYSAMNANRHGGKFFFDSAIHNRSGGEWVPQQSVNVLNRYRLNQSYPAFSNSTANGNPGTGAATSGDVFGTLNGNLDWDTSSIVDTPSQWQIRLFTVALTATTGTVAAPGSVTADVTPRRLQAFAHTPRRATRYEVRDAGSVLLTQGLAVADGDGLFTIPAVPITSAGTTLTLTPVSQSAPTIITINNDAVQLTWPTLTGVRYQIEWSPDLAQWFPVGSASLGTGWNMTWIDDGSATPSPPLNATERFYRLRLSPP